MTGILDYTHVNTLQISIVEVLEHIFYSSEAYKFNKQFNIFALLNVFTVLVSLTGRKKPCKMHSD